MSSAGRMRATTPLLPWRPAILSPTEILRVWATPDADGLVDGGGKFVLVLAGEDFHVDDLAAFAVGHAEGGVLNVAGLFAEDGAEEFFLGGELGFALGRDLADEDVAGAYFGADADDAALVQVAQVLFAHVGDVLGYLFRAQLGLTGLHFVLFDADGGEEIVLDQVFAEDYRVLVVVAFPTHEGDEDVLTQGQIAVVRGGTVGENLSFLDSLALLDDGPLVEAGALVGAGELGYPVVVLATPTCP